MYFITVESVNGGTYPSAGEFATIADAQRNIRTGYRGLSCYWRAWIWDGGIKVMKATRAGPNGTGERWAFEQCS